MISCKGPLDDSRVSDLSMRRCSVTRKKKVFCRHIESHKITDSPFSWSVSFSLIPQPRRNPRQQRRVITRNRSVGGIGFALILSLPLANSRSLFLRQCASIRDEKCTVDFVARATSPWWPDPLHFPAIHLIQNFPWTIDNPTERKIIRRDKISASWSNRIKWPCIFPGRRCKKNLRPESYEQTTFDYDPISIRVISKQLPN